MNRREFLVRSALTAPAVAWAASPAWAVPAGGGFTMGSQSYSFRNFDLNGAIACLKELGLNQMEFCAVHFPPDKDAEGFAGVKAAIESAGIEVPCYGVEGFTADEAVNRTKFEFAKALGIGILTADPTPDSFDSLDKLCEEYQIKIAIHNHGPKARYDKVSDTLNAVKGRSSLIGACLDTGHCIRSGEKPHETIEALGDRLISMHLKDWILGGEEQIIGKGDMDLAAVAKELKALAFTGPIMMEYEESPDNPVPDMKLGWENWQNAV
jgi:sugar phosphate isomerase/epimerase